MTRQQRQQRGGGKVSDRTKKRYRQRLLDVAGWAYHGNWTVAEQKPGLIVLRDLSMKPTIDDVHLNSLEMCKLRRYGHLSGAIARDVAIGRKVPWSCIELTWRLLKGPPSERPSSRWAGTFPMAMVPLATRFRHVMDCMEAGWQQPDWPRQGELWVRWGIDGVPRWSVSYITLTMALTGKHDLFKLHSVDRFAHAAVMLGGESVDSIQALLGASRMNAEFAALEGSTFVVQGKPLTVRCFILGDHMLQYKVTGANGPGSTLPHRQPCPWCDAPPLEVLDWSAAIQPVHMQPRPHAPLQGIPRDQCVPDAMHGCHNLLHTVVLGAVRQVLQDKGLPATEIERLSSIGLQRREDWQLDDDSAKKKSIAQTLQYWREGRFAAMLEALKYHITSRKWLTFQAIMSDMQGMLGIAYTAEPSLAQVNNFKLMADDLRGRLAYLHAPVTVWGHIWTVHLPQFLARWGSLFPFVCHGVEGKHRVFKADLQLSTGNQWRNSKWGFAQTLDLDRIRWQLFKCGKLARPHVPRSPWHIASFRAYEKHVLAEVCFSSLLFFLFFFF